MKKSLVITLLVLLVIFSRPLNAIAFLATNIMNPTLVNSYKASEHSREELYQVVKNQSEKFIKEVFSQNGEVKAAVSYIDPSSIKFNEYLTKRSEIIKNRINVFNLKHDNLVINLKFDSINYNGEFCEVKVVSTEKYTHLKKQAAVEMITYRILLKKQSNSSWMIYSATSDDSYSRLCEKKRKVANVDSVNLKEIEYKDYNYIMELEKKDIQQSKLSSGEADTKEIIYRDMIISLLVPYMQKEINNYYKEYLTELPIIFPYSVDIVNVEREVGSGFLIKLEVIAHPFVGPINTVGDDRMIIETGAFGSVSIKKFEHVKSYPLPWNWQHIIKKPY